MKRDRCILCDEERLVKILPMRPSPIADAFVCEKVEQELIPLDLYQCGKCGHTQNIDRVDPERLFRKYLFTTKSSPYLVKHFAAYAEEAVKRFSLPPQAFVCEIGSNDGTLLQFFKEKKMSVLGVDPAVEIANLATGQNIPTIPDFFSSILAASIKKEKGVAKLIVANNVYAHTDRLRDITKGIELLLDDDGVFIFEVSYLLDIIDNFLFDTIYHEHLCYHSITPLIPFFQGLGLELFSVERIPSKGGSIRAFVQKQGGPHKKEAVIDQMVENEKKRGLHLPEIFRRFYQDINKKKGALLEAIARAESEKKQIVGYGASNTVTTLIYQFELEKRLTYLVDDNVKKHHLFSPGAHLKVFPSKALYENFPALVILLAWQYATPILQKHSQFIENGGVFIIPLPTLQIIKK